MATYSLGEAYARVNETVPPADGRGVPFILQNTIDFDASNITSSGGDDIIQVLNIPANTLVLAAWYYVSTVDAGVTDVNVGFAGAADGTPALNFIDNGSFATAGYVYTAGAHATAQPGQANPGCFITTAADTLDVLFTSSDEIQAVVTFYALCVKLDIAIV